MKSDNHYESPQAEVYCIQHEGILCTSGNESVEENEGTWGELIN
jgi:hypothetical protein